MEDQYDYKKFAILYVDDEKKSLTSFTRAYSDDFRVFTATNAQDGFKLLEQHADEIGVLMTDQRMPAEKGVWLLERARQFRPRILRMLVTAYADMDAAIAAVNSGAIYKYVTKPWDPVQLDLTLRHGLEFFIVQTERDQLLREKMSVLRNLMIANRIVSLGLLAASLSHHIRNSLVAVKTFLDLAPGKMAEEKKDAARLRNPDFWKDYHQNAQGQVEKINGLLQDLWTVSENNGPAEFADEVRLHQAVGAALDLFKDQMAARRIEIDNRISDSLPLLYVDRPKFCRLFELLLKEEVAALPAGSRITLAAELSSDVKPEIVVRIADNGPGLPQEALDVIFDPFAVTDSAPSEYGFHLMACFFIVHHHGGKIEAHSEPGRGNTFTLHLPLKPEPAVLNPDDMVFLQKALFNEDLWGKLLSGR
jgi:two-component system probable response regulator PhcQ